MKNNFKIFIDIYHLPQFNLFKNFIKIMGPNKITLSCVNRSKLVEIIKHELPGYELHVIGDYKYNYGPISMIFLIIIPRILYLFKIIKKNKFKFVLTAHYQANFVAKLKSIRNISIIDDPRKIVLQLIKFSTKDVYLPEFSTDNHKTKTFIGLKEWSYLSPKYFSPDLSVLDNYEIKAKEYIFIREVDTNTSNYLSQDKNIILKKSEKIENKIKVVLSLENKRLINSYPSNWIILNEPVDDIHSLMYFSKIVISSGDSMAREGAMLGVDSIYLGNRDMPANKVLIDKGKLSQRNILGTVKTIKSHFQNDIDKEQIIEQQSSFRKSLYYDWDDVTELLINKVKELDK